MRRLIVLGVLLGLMFGLKALKSDSSGGVETLTLAAIGFVVLAAFTISEIGSALSLPRVTGYIVSGVLLGPHVTNILSSRVVEEMTLFNNLALGLIALGAGVELDAKQIAKIWRTLVSTIAIKLTLGVGLVAATLYLIQSGFHILDIGPGKPLLALAIIMGTLSLGTSPAIALAIINESRAKGRLTDIVLGAAVLKDLVVVVALALAISIAKALVAPAASSGPNVLVHVAQELAIGGALGVLLILYLKYIRKEMLLFVTALIIVASEIIQQFHLDLLLVFIAAGFVVRNFSKYEHELLHAVELVALPVYVIFFTIAGARVNLSVTYQVLPLALALCAARAFAYFVASRVGGVIGKESDVVQRQAWLGYLPQAGVTLGLVTIASKQLPELASSIQATGMAVVAINLLVGPITLRSALGKAGELNAASPEAQPPVKAAVAPQSQRPAVLTGHYHQKINGALEQIENELLAGTAARLVQRLELHHQTFKQRVIDAWQEQRLSSLTALDAPIAAASPGSVITAPPPEAPLPSQFTPQYKGKLLKELFNKYRKEIKTLPELAIGRLEPHHYEPTPADSRRLKLRKLRKRAALKLRLAATSRRIPFQAAARIAFEARLAKLLEQQFSAWSKAELWLAQAAANQQHSSTNKTPPLSTEELMQRATQHLDGLSESFEQSFHQLLLEGTLELVKRLSSVDSPELSLREIRISKVDAQVKESLKSIDRDAEAWSRAEELCRSEIILLSETQRLRGTYDDAMNHSIVEPMTQALAGVEQVLSNVERSLGALRREAEQLSAGDLDTGQVQALRQTLAEAARESFDEDEQAELEQYAAKFRAATSIHPIAVRLRGAIAELPKELQLPRAPLQIDQEFEPSQLRSREFEFRKETELSLVHDLLPNSDGALRKVATTVIDTAARLREARDISLAVLETEELEEQTATLEQLDRALARLGLQRKALERDITQASDDVEELADRSFNLLLERAGVAQAHMDLPLGSLLFGRLRQYTNPLWKKLAERRERLVNLYHEAVSSQLGRDVRLRYEGNHFDAGTIREYTERWRINPELPSDYLRLFSLKPVTERRLFTANHKQLSQILSHEASWLAGAPGNLLILGQHGSGRTSMLNVLELELQAPRVIRPEPLEWRRSIGLFNALAIELGVKPSLSALSATLNREQTCILIDDLEQWFPTTPQGLRQLERLVDLIIRTGERTNWVICIEKNALAAWSDLVTLTHVFTRLVQLGDQSGPELAEAILKRHQLSGRDISYPASSFSRALAALQRKDLEQVFFNLLARASSGNLARALVLWAHGASLSVNGQVRPSIDFGLSLGLPFVQRLEPNEVVTLIQIMRFGPQTQAELAESLAINRTEISRIAYYLNAAGLIERLDVPSEPFDIPRFIRPAVMQALTELRIER